MIGDSSEGSLLARCQHHYSDRWQDTASVMKKGARELDVCRDIREQNVWYVDHPISGIGEGEGGGEGGVGISLVESPHLSLLSRA